MKLIVNTIGINEISYSLDPAFDSSSLLGTTSYQAPNLKIKLDSEKDYAEIYRLFAEAGIEPEYDGEYKQDHVPQEPYYSSRHIIHFIKRENIVKAIKVLNDLKLIPETDEGKKLIDYCHEMSSEVNFQTEVDTKKILDWQHRNCDLDKELSVLEKCLLEKLNQKITTIKTDDKFNAKDIFERETYLQELKLLIDKNDDIALLKKISEGVSQFNRGETDLAYVLLREGEDFVQQYHVKHQLVYRREVFLNIIMAEEKYQIRKVGNFNYDIEGNPADAYPFLLKAAQQSPDYLGCPEAQFEIGRLFRLKALPIPTEEKLTYDEKAVQFYKFAAERNHPEALLKLGKMYMLGQGVEQQDTAMTVKYIGRVIGDQMHFWGSEPLEYILHLVDCDDKSAIEYLQNKLTYHQQELLKRKDLWLELVKINRDKFARDAEYFRYGRSYVVAEGDYSSAGITHLRQIHYIADRSDTDYTYRNNGYVFAKQILLETYQKMAQICDEQKITNSFAKIAESYKTRIERQIEDGKPIPKTPEELLFEAIHVDNPVEFVKQLKSYNQSKQSSDSLSLDSSDLPVNLKINGSPLICLAAEAGSLEIVRSLINQKADLTATSDNGEMALQKVCILFGLNKARKENRLKIAELLVDHGVSVNFGSGKEYTALHNAVLSEFDDMIKFLLSKQADVDAWDMLGRTPLNLLIDQHKGSSSASTIEILLKNDASINAEDKIGTSPWTQVCIFCPELKPLLEKYQHPSGPTYQSKHAREAQKLEEFAASLGLFGDKDKAMKRMQQRFEPSSTSEAKADLGQKSINKFTI